MPDKLRSAKSRITVLEPSEHEPSMGLANGFNPLAMDGVRVGYLVELLDSVGLKKMTHL